MSARNATQKKSYNPFTQQDVLMVSIMMLTLLTMVCSMVFLAQLDHEIEQGVNVIHEDIEKNARQKECSPKRDWTKSCFNIENGRD